MKNQLNIVIREACRAGLDEGVFCGVAAAASVFKKDGYHRGWWCGGLTRSDGFGQTVEEATLFDLASLTKPLCTTLCTLHLINQGKLQWDEECLFLLDSYPSLETKKINIRHLLQHSSGWPSYKPYYQQWPPVYSQKKKVQLIRTILREPLEYPTGQLCRYSDLGFIVLGALVENRAGISLDRLYATMITDFLHLTPHLRFFPLNQTRNIEKLRIAATEACPWRKKVMQGEVHDEHSWLMGGVAGHAGLFGTIQGVLSLCERLLDIWKGRASHPAFSRDALLYALTTKHPTETRRLGFDTPSPESSSSGRYFSPQSVGHLGFSGTSFWIDPEKDIIVVLLSNRIHPSRNNTKIKEFRPFFHNSIMEKIGDGV